MIAPGRGGWRIVRGTALAVACTVLAVAGHLAGGAELGSGPSAPHLPIAPLAVCAVLFAAGFVIAAERQRSFQSIATVSVGSQFVFHAAFALAGHDALFPDARMSASHVAAALVMAGLVARADALIWAIAELFGLRRIPDPAPAPVLAVRQVRPETHDVARTPVERFGRAHQRRGPPSLA